LVQTLFQNGEIAAVAKTIIVQIDEETGNSKPLSEKSKNLLKKYII
jgi:acyl-CoA thioesterase FadM